MVLKGIKATVNKPVSLNMVGTCKWDNNAYNNICRKVMKHINLTWLDIYLEVQNIVTYY